MIALAVAGVIFLFIRILKKMTSNPISSNIIKAARAFIGQKELSGNSGFVSKQFETRMRQVGWNTGEAWCMYLAELAVKEGAADLYAKCAASFSGHTLTTANNFKTRHPETIISKAVPGCLVIWRLKGDTSGHAGVCTAVSGDTMTCVEGNTNNDGSREGYITLEKTSPANRDRGNLQIYAMLDITRLKS